MASCFPDVFFNNYYYKQIFTSLLSCVVWFLSLITIFFVDFLAFVQVTVFLSVGKLSMDSTISFLTWLLQNVSHSLMFTLNFKKVFFCCMHPHVSQFLINRETNKF